MKIKFDISPILSTSRPIVSQIEALGDKLFLGKSNPQANTSNWERKIDRFNYELYDLI